MFTHILLASDGSEHAHHAAYAAAALAKKFGARLTLVNVHHPASMFSRDVQSKDASEMASVEKRQSEALRAAGLIIDGMGVAYQTLRESGHPVEQIVQAAKTTDADVIVVGSRGLGDIGSFLLGSVSDGVLRHAHCPVLIVRTPNEFSEEAMFQNILLASDGSECALKSAEAAALVANKFAARLTIINVFQPPIYTDGYGGVITWDLDEQNIGKIQEDAICSAGHIVDQHDVPYQIRKDIGNPAAQIVEVAEEVDCGLIVLGSRGLSGVEAFLVGSVSDSVAHYAHCAVLIVK